MPRTRGYGRRTVEQTRSVGIRDLRKAAYVGEAEGNWLDARNKLFCTGISPSIGTARPSPLMVRHSPWLGLLGTLVGDDLSSCADAAERSCSYLRHPATPGAVDFVTTLHTQLGKQVSATA